MAIKRNTKGFGSAGHTPGPVTLADVLGGLEHNDAISATRLRDLRSALQRVAGLLGEEPARVPLELPVISGIISDGNSRWSNSTSFNDWSSMSLEMLVRRMAFTSAPAILDRSDVVHASASTTSFARAKC